MAGIDRAAQLLLLAWFSPAFPVGGFAFSHGLEMAAEAGDLVGAPALERWLCDVIAHGSGRSDIIVLALSYRAFAANDAPALQDIVDLAAALQPSRERRQEATIQGQAFFSLVRSVYPRAEFTRAEGLALGALTLPVAAGFSGAAHDLPLDDLALAYLAGFCGALVSAAVRLAVVGQTDGQRVIAALHPVIARVAPLAATATPDDLGSAALASDLASLQHETQYSRLFRS